MFQTPIKLSEENSIETGGFWKNRIVASLVYVTTEEMKLTDLPCGRRLLERGFHVSLEFGEIHKQGDYISPSL